jgi:KTSC domain
MAGGKRNRAPGRLTARRVRLTLLRSTNHAIGPMPELKSRLISNAEYDTATNVLTLTFAESGRVYDFYTVPPSVYAAFLDAPSKGAFLNNVLKPRFNSVRRKRRKAA